MLPRTIYLFGLLYSLFSSADELPETKFQLEPTLHRQSSRTGSGASLRGHGANAVTPPKSPSVRETSRPRQDDHIELIQGTGGEEMSL